MASPTGFYISKNHNTKGHLSKKTLAKKISMRHHLNTAVALCALLVLLSVAVEASNEDFLGYRFFVDPISNHKRRMSSYSAYAQPFAEGIKVANYRPSWRVGAMGTMYKRVSSMATQNWVIDVKSFS